MNKIIVSLLIALTTSAAWADWAHIKKSGVLHLATEGSFRPFNVAEGGKFSGFEVELGNAIAKQLKLKPRWTAHAFSSLLPGLGQHQYDVVAASHAITPERARLVEFIDPHYCTGAVIVTREGGGRTTLRTLAGKTIGVSLGTTYADRLKAMARFKEVKVYRDDLEAVQGLAAGQLDAWITDRFAAVAMINAKPRLNLELGEALFPEMISMAVAKGDRELKQKINGALSALMADGTYLKLSERYFNRDISCRAMSLHPRSSSMNHGG